MDFDWNGIFGPALTAAASLFGNLGQQNINQQAVDLNAQQFSQQQAQNLEIEKMREQAALEQIAASFHPELTEFQKVQGTANLQDQYQKSIDSLISNYRGAIGR